MRLIKGSLAGLVIAGILTIMPALHLLTEEDVAAVMVGEAAVTDFMVASPVTVPAGDSVWEGELLRWPD